MYVLVFMFTTIYMGQPFSDLTVENVQYAVFDSAETCVEHLPSMSRQYKHKLLTEFQAVPLFESHCERAIVHNVDLNTAHFAMLNRKVSDDDINQ